MKKEMVIDAKYMKLPELAKKAGVSGSTVYDYLRTGLLQPPVKSSPTKSRYTDKHLERLNNIRDLKTQKWAMSDIREYFGCNENEKISSERAESVRVEIIDKALELFSKYHYEKTKISDITDALNIGSGTFYRYFDSKEELFLGCLERLPFVLVPDDAWQEVDKETDFILRLKKRGYAMLNAFPSYIGILNYAKQSLSCGDEVLAGKAAECIKSLVAPLKKDLKKAIKLGRVRQDIDIEMCAYLLLGINETFGYRTLIEPEYSVEYGFGVIEDFLNHALAVHNNGDEKNTLSCEVVDITGNTICIDLLSFNSKKSISGKYLEGELEIYFSDVLSIDIIEKEGHTVAEIILLDNEMVEVKILRDDVFSGKAFFGLFSIKSESIKSIKMLRDSQF